MVHVPGCQVTMQATNGPFLRQYAHSLLFADLYQDAGFKDRTMVKANGVRTRRRGVGQRTSGVPVTSFFSASMLDHVDLLSGKMHTDARFCFGR